jgi:molybdopterin-guanine dinucleotide biosynthesis protein A
LAKLCAPGIGAVARTREGYEPLAAIYPYEALDKVQSRLNKGEFALQAVIKALVRSRKMRVLRLKSTECRQLANWNTPGDIG